MRTYHVVTVESDFALQQAINNAAKNGNDFKIESVSTASSVQYRITYTLVYSYGPAVTCVQPSYSTGYSY